MTREEAITLIKAALKTMYLPKSKEYISDLGYALEIAIKALEQEPCEDAISRQAVLDIVNNPLNIRLDEIIKKTPSVTPQPKTGHWIYDNYNWRCSECNETPKTLGYVGTADFMTEHFKFCNHCGAKMESEG